MPPSQPVLPQKPFAHGFQIPFVVLFAGVAAASGALHLAGISLFGPGAAVPTALAASGLTMAAAAFVGRRIGIKVAYGTELATRFAAGGTDLRLRPSSGISEFHHLAEVLNSIADLVQDRELQLSLLSEATGDLVWDWDLASDLVTCRGGATAAIGLAEDSFEFSNDWWLERVHPDHRAALIDSFQRAFGADDRLWSEEYLFRHEDGGYRWFWDRGVIVRTASGAPVRVIGCMTDISAQRAAEDNIRASERRYRSLVTATSSIVWSALPDGTIASPHPHWEEYTGQTEAQYWGLGWLDAFHPEDRESVREAWTEALATGKPYEVGARVRRRDGMYRWIASRGVPVRDEPGAPVEWIGVIVDVHDECEARLQLLQRTTELGERVKELDCFHAIAVACNQDDLSIADILERTVAALPRSLMEPDAACCEIEWNGTVLSSRGGERIGTRFDQPILVAGTKVGRVTIGYPAGIAKHDLLREEKDLLTTVAALLGQMIARRADRERILHTANHDVLTGLPNRLRFQEELETAFRVGANGPVAALLLIDLDHFKDVNDTLGHDTGDALLAALGARLAAIIGARGVVARLGGDEFAVALFGARSGKAAAIAGEVLAALRDPIRFAGKDISTRATIGVAEAPRDGVTSAELLKSADIALYFGKSSGRNSVAIYRPSMRDVIESRVSVCAEVRDSLAGDVFVPYYQPKVSLHAHRITGFEALLRWKHPTRGLQDAGAVQPAFEDHELALALGDRIREHVLQDMQTWRRKGIEFHRVAINLSSAEFARADLATRILDQLQAAGLAPHHLGVEVTETVLLGREADVVTPILGALHDSGVQIALDDFGTGYASLTHLQRYPVDVIKVDQSFVRSILTDSGSQAITSVVVQLGRRLGMTVVAEGVESAAQADLLQAAGCDEAQGFYFAKAMPASRVPYILGGSEQLHWAARAGAKNTSSAA